MIAGQHTAELKCEKADLHRGILQHLITQWQHQHQHIEHQLKQHTALFNDILSSPMTGASLSKALSQHTIRQVELENRRQQIAFPSLCSVQLSSSDSATSNNDYFNIRKSGAQNSHLHLQPLTRQSRLTINQQLLTTSAFTGSVEALLQFNRTMEQLIQDCCLLESSPLSPASSTLQQNLHQVSQQLQNAIAEIIQLDPSDESTQTLHHLRIQEAVLERYLTKVTKTPDFSAA